MRVGEGRPFGEERTDGLGLEAEGGREVTVAQRVTGGIVTTEEDIDTGVIARGVVNRAVGWRTGALGGGTLNGLCASALIRLGEQDQAAGLVVGSNHYDRAGVSVGPSEHLCDGFIEG